MHESLSLKSTALTVFLFRKFIPRFGRQIIQLRENSVAINSDTVPSVLCYGAHDKMQPFAASKPLVAALEKNGVDYRYFVAKHSGHGLQNDNKVYMEYLDAVVEYLDKYMKE